MAGEEKLVRELSEEEADQFTRSNKKIKGLEQGVIMVDERMDERPPGEEKADQLGLDLVAANLDNKKENQGRISYRDKLLKANGCVNLLESELEHDKETDEDSEMSDREEEGKNHNALCPVISISKEEWKALCEPWKLCLAVKLLGKTLGFRFLKARLQKLWVKDGSIEFIDLGNDVFLVKFSDQRDYNFALTEGPWVIADHYLMVQRWYPDFDPYMDEFRRIPVWIRVPGLPIVCYNKHFLWKLGNHFGRTLKVDVHTINGEAEGIGVERGKFARICIEIDLKKQLVTKYELRGKVRHVQYEGLKIVCFNCGLYGHHKDVCPLIESRKEAEKSDFLGEEHLDDGKDQVMEEVIEEVGEGDFGPWMLVKKQNRKAMPKVRTKKTEEERGGGKFAKTGMIHNQKTRQAASGSRFEVFDEYQEEEAIDLEQEFNKGFSGKDIQTGKYRASSSKASVVSSSKGKGKEVVGTISQRNGVFDRGPMRITKEVGQKGGVRESLVSLKREALKNKSEAQNSERKEWMLSKESQSASKETSQVSKGKENLTPVEEGEISEYQVQKPPDISSLEIIKWAQRNMPELDQVATNLGATRVVFQNQGR